MASPTETASWERNSRCGCKGCAVARKEGGQDMYQAVIEILEERYNDLSSCRKDDDCKAEARGAWLAFKDVEYFMEESE